MSVQTTAALDGENRVITIEISALQAKADNLADDAAKFYYNTHWKNEDQFKTDVEGELQITEYENLTAQQKLSILGLEAQYWLLHGAKAYYKNEAVNTAKSTAESEIATRY